MKKKMQEIRVEKILGSSFLGVGVLLFTVAFICAIFSWNTKRSAEEVAGIITDIGSSNVTVSYSLNGQQYDATIDEYSSSMVEGEKIRLYVNRENPHKVRTGELLYLPTFILCVVGIPFTVMGIVFLLVAVRRKKKKQYLMQNGRKIFAEVTGGSRNYYYEVNGRHPWKLECKYDDPSTGAVYLFASGNIRTDPQFYVGQQVAVYVDGENYKKYYVDVESLISSQNSGTHVYDYR